MTWRRLWVAYIAAHVGKSLLWTSSDLLTLYLLVSLYRLEPMTAGGLFLIGLAANALADLAFGIAYSTVDVSHNALLTRLGDTPARAVSLARGRTVGTALASLLAASVAGGGILPTALLLWIIAGVGVVVGTGCCVAALLLVARLTGSPGRGLQHA